MVERARARVLVIAKTLPWPANSGEKQRTLGMVRALRRLGEVTVVGFSGVHEDVALADADGISVRVVPLPRKKAAPLLVDAVRERSITAGKWRDERLATLVEEEVARGVDVVVVEHVQMAGHLPTRLPDGVVTVLDMHNVESVLTRRFARTTRSWRRPVVAAEAVALRRLERSTVARFDVVCCVSAVDRDALALLVEHPDVLVVPNAVDVPTDQDGGLPPAKTPTACYVGLMSWAPNADAAVVFTEQVWPTVRKQLPDARLLIVGRDPAPQVLALAGDSVEVTGTVPGLVPYYARSRVALAPLLAGGGSRLKILEALAYGRPVLATSVGAEGLEDLVGRGVVIADEPARLAAELASLLADPDRCVELGAAGLAAVRADHSWEAATAPLLRRLEAVHEQS